MNCDGINGPCAEGMVCSSCNRYGVQEHLFFAKKVFVVLFLFFQESSNNVKFFPKKTTLFLLCLQIYLVLNCF